MDMVELVCRVEQKKKKIALLNDTVRCRINDTSQDILSQVADEILASKAKISIQLDESTDVSNCAYLLVLVLSICACWRVEREVLDVRKFRDNYQSGYCPGKNGSFLSTK